MAAGDLKSVSAIYFKGGLFLLLGLLAVATLIAQHASWQFVALLGIAIWSFCRAYYFAFYVIEHYVDATYHFAGLIDFVRYLCGRQRA